MNAILALGVFMLFVSGVVTLLAVLRALWWDGDRLAACLIGAAVGGAGLVGVGSMMGSP